MKRTAIFLLFAVLSFSACDSDSEPDGNDTMGLVGVWENTGEVNSSELSTRYLVVTPTAFETFFDDSAGCWDIDQYSTTPRSDGSYSSTGGGVISGGGNSLSWFFNDNLVATFTRSSLSRTGILSQQDSC